MSPQFQPVSERRSPLIGQLPKGLEKLPDSIEEDTFYSEEKLNESEAITQETYAIMKEIEEIKTSRAEWMERAQRNKAKRLRAIEREKMMNEFGGFIRGGPEPRNDLVWRGGSPLEGWGNPQWGSPGIERMFGPLGGKI